MAHRLRGESAAEPSRRILSAQLGTDSTGWLVPGGIGPETRQALTGLALGARLELECLAVLSETG